MSQSSRKSEALNCPTPLAARPDGGPILAAWVVCFYLAITFLGVFALMQKGVTPSGSEIPPAHAAFIAVSAATLTGMPTTHGFSAGGPGQTIVLILTLAGALTSLIAGGLAAVRILRLPYSDLSVVFASILACVIALAVGPLALPPLPPDMPAHAALDGPLLGISAFGNSGVYADALPGAFSWRTHMVLLPLVMLGGFGLPVLLELGSAVWNRRPISRHSRIVLAMSAGLYLALLVAFFLLLSFEPDKTLKEWNTNIATSSIAAVNSRTAGIPFDYVSAFPRAMQWLLVLAMMIGASPAGTGGGLKTTTIYELFSGVRRILRGQVVGRPFGIAATWLGAYLLIAFVCLLAVLRFVPEVPTEKAMLLTISALSNVGLCYDRINVGTSAFYPILMAAMLAGRLMPLAILWWLASTSDEAEVAIG